MASSDTVAVKGPPGEKAAPMERRVAPASAAVAGCTPRFTPLIHAVKLAPSKRFIPRITGPLLGRCG